MKNIWKLLGPGILLAATSIGSSHLVLSPQAGALFGFELLWLVLLTHILKYPAFEFGPRYAAATGQSLLAGYGKMPGPKGWALVLFLVSTVLQGVGVLAGVVSVSGCVMATWSGLLDTQYFSIVTIAVVLGLLFVGGFKWLDHLNKVMMAVLTIATILAFIPIVPSPSVLKHMVIPVIPAGSIVLVAAILGWMPTGIDVSIWHSFWTLEKFEQLGMGTEQRDPVSVLKKLRISLSDMRTGYALSLITGVIFMTIGVVHLNGRGDQLSGVQFAEAISTAYTDIFGRWMYHVFMLTAFFAMFSTSYTVIDGFSRSFSQALANLKENWSTQKAKKKTYTGFVLASAVSAVTIILLIGNPVTLVTAAALLSLAAAPILYALNLMCISKHIKEPTLKPAKITVITGWLGTIFMLVALSVTIYVKLLS